MRASNAAIVVVSVSAIFCVATLMAQKPVMRSSVFEWESLKATPNKTGAVRQVAQAPTPALEELEMHVTTLNPGESPHPPHQHPAEELIIVKEGTVESSLNGVVHRVGPGSIIFQASNEMHGIHNAGPTAATYYVIRWAVPHTSK